jgi:hypothetical protein
MDPLLEIIKFLSTRLGGKPGTYKWEVVTAIFGWAAAAALLSGLVASLVGFSSVASWTISVFSAAMTIALKRDLTRIFRS